MARKQFGHRRDVKFPIHSQRILGKIFDSSHPKLGPSLKILRTDLKNLGVLSFFPPDLASSPWDTKIEFNEKTFDVQIVTNKSGQVLTYKGDREIKSDSPLHYIYITPDLIDELKRTYISTYRIHLEARMRAKNGEDYYELTKDSWHEFVNIEFDLKSNLMKWHAPKIPLDNLQDYYDYLNEQYPDSVFSNNSEPISVIDPARRLPPGPICTKRLMIEGRTGWGDWFNCLDFCLFIAEQVKNNKMTTDDALSLIEQVERTTLSRKVGKAIGSINMCHRQNHPPKHPQEQITLLWPHPTTFRSTGVNGATNRPHPREMKGLEQLNNLCKQKGIELRIVLC